MIVIQGWVLVSVVIYNVMILGIIWFLWGRVIKLENWRRNHINLAGAQHGLEYKD